MSQSQGEKGTDVALAVDALQTVLDDKIDVAVLVTGDGDFVPLARAMNKRAFGFWPRTSTSPTRAARRASSTNGCSTAAITRWTFRHSTKIVNLRVRLRPCSEVQANGRIGKNLANQPILQRRVTLRPTIIGILQDAGTAALLYKTSASALTRPDKSAHPQGEGRG